MCSDSFGGELTESFETTEFHIGPNGEMIGSRPIVPGEMDEYMIEAVQEAADAAGISITHLLEQHQQQQQLQQQQLEQQQPPGGQHGHQGQGQQSLLNSTTTTTIGTLQNSAVDVPGALSITALNQMTLANDWSQVHQPFTTSSLLGPTSMLRQTTARLRRTLSRPITPIEIQVDAQGQLRRIVYRQNNNSRSHTSPRRRLLETFRSLSQVGQGGGGLGGGVGGAGGGNGVANGVAGLGGLGVFAAAGLGNHAGANGNNGGNNVVDPGAGPVRGGGGGGGSNRTGGEVMNHCAKLLQEINMTTEPQTTSSASATTGRKKYTSPFSQFNISSTDILDTIEKKHCPTCNKNVRYFCNKCLHLVNCPEGAVPQLKLPIKLDIIKHEQERDGKSTALHAKILAPQDVEVYAWKEMPKYENVDRLLLLFPCPEAKQLSEIDPASFDKLVVIDGTWEQASKMSKSDSPLLRMKRVTIAPHETLFWRHQRKASDHLATIEAIYYFLREYHETYLSGLATPNSTEPIGSASKQDVVISTMEQQRTKEPASSSTSLGQEQPQSQQQHQQQPQETSTKVVSPHCEWIDSLKLGPYTNQFDDMLWFYKYFYELIQKTYRERTDGREFTLKHKKGYIQYHTEDTVEDPKNVAAHDDSGKSKQAATTTSTTANNSSNDSDNQIIGHSKPQGTIQEEEAPFSLVTHPAIVYSTERLSDPAYINNLHTVNVFDFDQTLFQSPLPNPALWDPSFLGILTSWNYCGTGWWHNPGTLELGPETEATCWKGWWNEDIVNKVKESSKNPGCLTVLLTGRNGPTFGQKLIEMVNRKGLDFDLIATKPTTVAIMDPASVKPTFKHASKTANDTKQKRPVEQYLKVHTFNTKHDFLYNVLFEFPSIRSMHLWDDRPCQVAKFRQAGQEWLDKRMLDHFDITVVQEPLLYMDPKRETELVMSMVEQNNQQVDTETAGGPYLVPGIGPLPRTRSELSERNIWDPYETYVPQQRLKIEVTKVVRYTGVMFSEPVQKIMRERLITQGDTGSVGSAVKEPWIERPLPLRGQDLSKWVVPDDLHVTLCLGVATSEHAKTTGGLGATVLVEVESVGEFEGRIWALKVKEMDPSSSDERELLIVAPSGEVYPSVEALRSAYSSNGSSTVMSPTSSSCATRDMQEHQDAHEALISLTLVDLDRMGRLISNKAVPPHITMAYDRLNGTRAVDSGKITEWENLSITSAPLFSYRLVFVGTIAEKRLLGMKSRKGPSTVTKAEVSVASIIKSLTGDKDIPGKDLGEMIRCVKEEMERLSVENRIANEERIATIAQEVCDRVETMKRCINNSSPVVDQ
ncbi:DTW domain-containing protein 1 [Mortierella sp. GBA30]|nr:DTW domain-containing protein 1 [Mortierella sp. GBA30]